MSRWIFASLKQPLTPSPPVTDEFEQELLAMAAMGDVPDVAGERMTIRAGHGVAPLEHRFERENGPFKQLSGRYFCMFC